MNIESLAHIYLKFDFKSPGSYTITSSFIINGTLGAKHIVLKN